MLGSNPVGARHHRRRRAVSAPWSRALSKTAFAAVLQLLLLASAHATTYYVSTTGDDLAAGTAEAPWRSIGVSVRKLQDGDVLVTRPGTFAEGDITPGLHTDPITIRAEVPRATTIDATGFDFAIGGSIPASGLRLIGLRITNSSSAVGIGFYGEGTDIGIDNCEVTGCKHSIRIKRGSAVAIRNSHVHGNYNGIALGDKGESGVGGALIEDCVLADNGLAGGKSNTDGVIAEAESANLVIRRCIAYGNGDAGFDVKPVGSVLERCLAYGNAGEGFKVWGRGSRLINCMARHNLDTGITIAANGVELWNCTVAYNTKAGLRPGADDNRTIIVRNSIFVGNENRQYDKVLLNDDYNLYYAPAGGSIWRMTLDSGTLAYTAADARARRLALGAHTIYADPCFIKITGGNVAPGPNSPALHAGTWAPFLTEDLLGNKRRLGAPPDLGAITGAVPGK